MAGVIQAMRLVSRAYSGLVRGLVIALGVVAGIGVMTMMSVTCADVLLRVFRRPIAGAYDIVQIAGAITISCALPYTTAVKGHVAIEYFFLKLPRVGRIVVDTLARLIAISLFVFLAWQSIRYGNSLHASGQVTLTLQLPVFWVPYVIGTSCAVVAMVILHNLIHPGRETIKP